MTPVAPHEQSVETPISPKGSNAHCQQVDSRLTTLFVAK
jgi:hypothetical protein